MSAPYIVLAAEGRFRVLQRQLDPARPGPAPLREIFNEEDPEARATYTSRETDQAGRFPGNAQQAGMSIDERLPMKQEEHRRAVDWLVECIEKFMTDRPSESWVFAAGPSIHNPVLERLRPSLREALTESVQKNLINIPDDKLGAHFMRV